MQSLRFATPPVRLARRTVFWFGALLAFFWLATIGVGKLLNPDEARYAEIPREMLVSGDWITPRLDGLKYFEKPALQYWTTAVAYRLFGIGEFTARLWCGLTGLAGIALAGWTGARLFGARAGAISAALLGGSLMYFVLGHVNTLDMGLAFFLQAAVSCFLIAQSAVSDSVTARRYMRLAWIAAALAFLSKGLVALVLPALALLAYSLVERDFSLWRRLHIGAGLPWFAAICAPWFIAVSLANPEFPAFFFLHEHFARFLTDVHDRAAPWWYFLPLLFVGVTPWMSLAAAAVANGWRIDGTPMNARQVFRVRHFLILWVAVTTLFFSLSHSKLPTYILPAMPMLALLAGDYASRATIASVRRHLLGMAVALALLLIAVCSTPPLYAAKVSAQSLTHSVQAGAVGLSLAFVATVLAWRRSAIVRPNTTRNALLTASLGALVGFSILLGGAEALQELRSNYALAQEIRPHLASTAPVYAIHAYDHSLTFYLSHIQTPVDYRGELDFGLQREPEHGVPDVETFVSRWRTDPPDSIAIMPQTTYASMRSVGLPMMEIGRGRGLVAVKRQAAPAISLAGGPSAAYKR